MFRPDRRTLQVRKISRLFSLLIIVTGATSAFACTVFYGATDEVVLVGNNEEYFNPKTKIWFHPSSAGQFGRIYFGWENEMGLPMGGMNERGLFFDWLAVPPLVVGRDRDRDPYVGGLTEFVRRMMQTCSTLEEAISLYRKLDVSGRWEATLIVGDSTGNCALFEGTEIVRKEKRWFVATNFLQSRTPPDEIACARHKIVSDMLHNAKQPSVELFRRALKAVHGENPNPTVYSNIYDLRNKVVYLYHFHDYENVQVLDLKKELARGERCIDLPSLFVKSYTAQTYENSATDYDDIVVQPFPADVSHYGELVGKYANQDYVLSVDCRGGDLYVTPSMGLRYRLEPIGEDRFLSRRLGTFIEFEFYRNRSAEVALLLLKVNGASLTFPKTGQASGRQASSNPAAVPGRSR
jgi:hypothetical protein